MKRIAAAVLATGLVVAGASAASAEGHVPEEFPEHGHVLLIGADVDVEAEQLIGVRKCVDLAAGNALPLVSHHEHVHFGRANEALMARTKNLVIPTAPLTPWTDCASLLEFFGLD